MKKYGLWYDAPAPMGNEYLGVYTGNDCERDDDGWEKWSLPIGNGYLGVNIFGRTATERLQITENSMANPYELGGLNNFAECYLDFGHAQTENYRRWLSLKQGTAGVQYTYQGTTYYREHFASYPDRVFVTRLWADQPGKISFGLRAQVPYTRFYQRNAGDGGGKAGTVYSAEDRLILKGRMFYHNILFEGQFQVLQTGGRIENQDGMIRVWDADEAVIIVAVGTNYHLESRVFSEPDPQKKLEPYAHPHEMVTRILDEAASRPYDELYARHQADYQGLFGRVSLDLGGVDSNIPTDRLLKNYQNGDKNKYLEELYFQYGRYLLISSSRPGTLPANLQGVWNRYDSPPFTAGYWHNINVQMNYWPAFPANLAETFSAYTDYCQAYLPEAHRIADAYIAENYPQNYQEGDNGWIIGTAAWPYSVDTTVHGKNVTWHSGVGNGPFIAKMFWDYYEFTQDPAILKGITYPILSEMAKFVSKTLEEHGEHLLVTYSASPEQYTDNSYTDYYRAVGCAFDQQMVWECYRDTLKAMELLGIENELTRTIRSQMGRLDPVIIGRSGQIKEFREEEYYGEIGEKDHRHISQLIGLCPGTLISPENPEWMEAAKKTLRLRGDKTTGWGMAFRLNLWARTREGDKTYSLLKALLQTGTLTNLWDTHTPFQIDGNFGGTAGICEMLLQSHNGYLDVLPAVPAAWMAGEYKGLCARGGFTVSASWSAGLMIKVEIHSKSGRECAVRCPGTVRSVETQAGTPAAFQRRDGLVIFPTESGETYSLLF